MSHCKLAQFLFEKLTLTPVKRLLPITQAQAMSLSYTQYSPQKHNTLHKHFSGETDTKLQCCGSPALLHAARYSVFSNATLNKALHTLRKLYTKLCIHWKDVLSNH